MMIRNTNTRSGDYAKRRICCAPATRITRHMPNMKAGRMPAAAATFPAASPQPAWLRVRSASTFWHSAVLRCIPTLPAVRGGGCSAFQLCRFDYGGTTAGPFCPVGPRKRSPHAGSHPRSRGRGRQRGRYSGNCHHRGAAGIGEPFFDSVESEIAHLAFAIPAVKGIEFGAGFAFADLRGSQATTRLPCGTAKW